MNKLITLSFLLLLLTACNTESNKEKNKETKKTFFQTKRMFALLILVLQFSCAISQNDSVFVDYGRGKQIFSKEAFAFYNVDSEDTIFNFNTVADNKLEFDCIDFKNLDFYGTHETIIDSIVVRDGNIDSNIKYVHKIDEYYELFLFTYKYQYDSDKDSDEYKIDIPYFEINKYKIDSLFYGKDYNESIYLRNVFHRAKFRELYRLDYNNRIYFLCYPYCYTGNSSIMNYKPVLFYFNQKNTSQVHFIENDDLFQHTSNSLCFNDFDEDGVLDYLHLENDKDNHEVIYGVLYSIVGNKFVKRQDHFLYLYDCEYGKLPKIDTKKSSWF
jgi:hypothetical protein